MGAICSCFTRRHHEHEEISVHDSRNRNTTHQNHCSIFYFFTKYTSTLRATGRPQLPSPNNATAPSSTLNRPAENSKPIIHLSFAVSGAPTKQGKSEGTGSSDEEVCSTCFEEYNAENPKIITKCSHHYHLACISAWLERSQTCPHCRRVMIFSELNL